MPGIPCGSKVFLSSILIRDGEAVEIQEHSAELLLDLWLVAAVLRTQTSLNVWLSRKGVRP